MIEIAVIGAVVQAAAAKVTKIVTPNWRDVLLRHSFILGTLLALFLTFVAGHPEAMALVHKLLPNASDLAIAKYLNYAMVIAMFLKQGGLKKIYTFWKNLTTQADGMNADDPPPPSP